MTQFKEHEIEWPDFLGESWNDSSWQNDACAHATLFLTPDESGTGPVVEFWVNYRDPRSRGIEPRFIHGRLPAVLRGGIGRRLAAVEGRG
jgi:hypothetical protein